MPNSDKAIELAQLSNEDTVLDAYCGIGTIGLVASKQAKSVIGFEINGEAVKSAIENAKLNKIKNVRFYKASDSEFFDFAGDEKLNFSTVFLDPPRAGCSQSFLSALCSKIKPKKIVYISCNPDPQTPLCLPLSPFPSSLHLPPPPPPVPSA